MQANASKHEAMSYERMCEEEKRLAEEVNALLAHTDTIDGQGDSHRASPVRASPVAPLARD